MNKNTISNPKIVVIDYGMGNVGSILNMLRYIGANVEVATEPKGLDHASGILLPGVGHFDRAMDNLNKSGMADAIKDAVYNRSLPALGICLGMQLMCKSSEEGSAEGLGFVDAHVRRFRFASDSGLKVPHMGWNKVLARQPKTVLGGLNEDSAKFYFVHSYYVSCDSVEDIIGTTFYGEEFTSAFQHKDIIGVQFHPEKSHKYGMRLLGNFAESLT